MGCLPIALFAFAPASPARAAEGSLHIRFNTVGYLPQSEKKATIAAPCANFAVIRMADSARVLGGRVSGPLFNTDTQEQLYTADFSPLAQPGEYRLEVPGVGQSAPFRVAADIFREPFQAVTRGFYLWRCGTAVSGAYQGRTFAHAPCHTNDAWLDFVGGGHTQQDGTGGWHDAGDYNKYVVNAGVTVGVLFRAWEDFGPRIARIGLDIPESGGRIPDFLAELKFEIDWLLKMQAPDGSVYHKITTKRFGPFVPPEAEIEERFFTPWGSEATADFVAMTAQAARIYRAYDPAYADTCLLAAWKSYRFLKAHPEYHRADLTGFRTGSYQVGDNELKANGPPNNRLWAEAELWQTTGDAGVLRDLEGRIQAAGGSFNSDFDWTELKNLGLLTYVLSERPGRNGALLRLVRRNLLATADDLLQTRNHHAYARPLGTAYYWGCNGGVARQTLLLMTADRIATLNPPPFREARGAEGLMRRPPAAAPKTEYRAAALDALNHLLGRNSYGRSFVTGVGFSPPMHPHDRRSGGDNVEDPWPGYLVGGPHPRATDWKDVQSDARTNEIAINWNAALVYALAAFLAE